MVIDVPLDPENTSVYVLADAACRSLACAQKRRIAAYRSHIYTKDKVGKPVSACQQYVNRRRSKVRSRIEHLFAPQQAMGGKHLRTIGLARAPVKVAFRDVPVKVAFRDVPDKLRRSCRLEAATL